MKTLSLPNKFTINKAMYQGRMAIDDDYDITVKGDSVRAVGPDGRHVFTLVHDAVSRDFLAQAWSGLRGYFPNAEQRRGVISGVIGYYDRYGRFPYCRQCAWNMNHPELFANCLPLFQQVSSLHRQVCRTEWDVQRQVSDQTHQDFLIQHTIYSTVKVNKNYRAPYHQDSKNQAGGFSAMLLIRDGQVNGGRLVFPAYRTAVEMDTGDLILFNGAEEWHGTTPIVPMTQHAQRCTLVFYLRSGMIHCRSAGEELARAKKPK